MLTASSWQEFMSKHMYLSTGAILPLRELSKKTGSIPYSEVLVRARRCPVCCRPLHSYCTIGANHISLLHLRKVIQLQADLGEWRRHLLSYNVLRSLCVALHPLGCVLSNVHCSFHHELDAIVQATTIYDRNTAEYTVPSGQVQRAPYLLPYLYV